MSPLRQSLVLTAFAVLGFLALRSLPDTHCALLHAEHEPVVVDGVEFCGVNEEANFYSPKALRFPVRLELAFAATRDGGSLKLLGEDGRPLLAHELAVSHTRKLHLHLRQVTGRPGYVHLHPAPSEDGTWSFTLPAWFTDGNPGGRFQAYVDFVTVRSSRVQLAETTAELEVLHMAPRALTPRNVVRAATFTTRQAGQSAMIRVTLASPAGRPPLKLRPLMGSLGHAVLFGDPDARPGYAHMHPSLEGGEFGPDPTLSFRLRLPPPGRYDLWVNIDDGAEDYLLVPIEVTP